ncbi:SDR family NAD(P)-dependent oxidoreductase [Paenibacillus kobensis]|uniref:SDR family NAD(P)-dependent oxidoreductase n=1 Tax=Paenibacillus kobensis TaxID=59841 RepID=UPI000FDACF53|nr:SDR family NAD(P)-dependent oxidoreductase [Paenibacillus kobensis]
MSKDAIRGRKEKLLQMLESGQIRSEGVLSQLRDLYSGNKEEGEAKHYPDRLLYRTEWAEAPLAASPETMFTPCCILLLDTDRSLWSHLQQYAGSEARLILALPGEAFEQTDEYTFVLHPSRETDYREMMQTLARQGGLPHRIIHRWSRRHDGVTIENLAADIERAAGPVISLTYLARALMEHKVRHEVDLQYVYTTAPGVIRPVDGAVSAFGQSLAMENDAYRFRSVQVELEEGETSAAAQLGSVVCAEFGTGAASASEVVYRNGRRMVPVWKRADHESSPDIPLIKSGGVYLITGGLGGAGYSIARQIADKADVKLVLSGRSKRSKKRDEKLQALKELGAEVLYIQADVSNQDETAALVDRIRRTYGRLDGIVHCAGVHYDGYVLSKSNEDTLRTLGPKLAGTVHLDEAVHSEQLDFFILFSSMAARFGNAGQSDYACANRMMDLYAEYRNVRVRAGERHGVTLSVNWTHWAAGGMKVPEQAARTLRDEAGLLPLPEGDAWALMEAAAALRETVCFAGVGDRPVFKRFLDQLNSHADSAAGAAADEEKEKVEAQDHPVNREWLRSRTEALLKQVFEEALKLPPSLIRPDRTFQEYGVDSIMVEQFNLRMERYAGHLPKTLLFEYQTISELTDYMLERHGAAMNALFPAEQPKRSDRKKAQSDQAVVESAAADPITTAATTSTTSTSTTSTTTNSTSSRDIAIIGLSGRFPEADTLEQFWNNLINSRDSITEVPPDRWDANRYYDPDPEMASLGKMYCKQGGFLRNVDRFDYGFFSISPREAATMDPQERLFLTLCWEAMEDAGYTRPSNRTGAALDSKVGVFAGVTTNTYALLGPEQWMKGNIVIPNSMPWSIANRVSYHFNFTGPSMPVDTACASGLTAIHLAAESILKGECAMAIAGGVNMYLHPSRYVGMCAMRMLSKKGRCSTFGEDADGFVPGEGAGVVLLKPLEQAVADGDAIYGVIKGTAVNHGGTTSGYTVPNPNAQSSLIMDALDKAGLHPRTISYMEAHGTGTSLGDPIEIAGLTKAFGAYTEDERFCAIGSVKSNIGHLESAAGIAGLFKVLLQMKHKQLVPTLHASRPNPKIAFERSPFYVQQETAIWEQPLVRIGGTEVRCPRRAGISSFGAGGANAHIIVEEYDQPYSETKTTTQGPYLYLLSARNEERLRAYARKLLQYVEDVFGGDDLASDELDAWLPDAAYTSQIGREPMKARAALLCESGNDLIQQLQALGSGETVLEHLSAGMAERAAEHAEADDAYVRELLAKRNLADLAQLWVGGLELDWRLLHEPGERRKVTLPIYPFAKERCWIRLADNDLPAAEQAGRPLHALIDRNESNFAAYKFSKHFTGSEFFLEDHLHMLPAVVYMEMARAAGQLADVSSRVTHLSNVVFASPIMAAAGGVETETLLFPRDDETADFEIRTVSDTSRGAHAQGTLRFGSQVAGTASSSIDISAVMRRCEGGQEEAQLYYRHLASIGAPFGPRFQGIGAFYWNEEEALSAVRMPDGLEQEQSKYALHPTYADACLQTVIAWAYRTSADLDSIYLPFVIGELELAASPLPQAAFVYAKRQASPGASTEEAVYEANMLDENGNVIASFRDYSVRPFQPYQAGTPASNASELHYFRPEWHAGQLQERSAGDRRSHSVILLFDEQEEVAESLRKHADCQESKVIRVARGSGCGWTSDSIYELHPGKGQHYEMLLDQLTERYGPFAGERGLAVVHAWSQELATDSLSQMLERGIVSVFHMMKALQQCGLHASLLFVHATEQTEPHPAYAAVSGFASSVSQESEEIRFRTVALTGHSRKPDDTADLIAAELSFPAGTADVRYAGQERQERRMVRHAAEKNAASLRENGTYMITGGAGGLGKLFAHFLAAQYGARLVLVGRSGMNGAIEQLIAGLRQSGGHAVYMQADIGVPGEAERVVHAAREAFGPIHGVLHCAGTVRDGMLRSKSWSDMEAVMLPKVNGLMQLGEALRNEQLDLFALFSSLSAFGNAGQSDYAYANSFLDHYAARFAGKAHFGKLLSINWPYWYEGGMRLGEQELAALEARHGFRPLDSEDGTHAFSLLLGQQGCQYAVVNGDAQRIQAAFSPERTDEVRHPVSPSAVQNTAADAAAAMELFRADFVKSISAVLQLRESEIQMNSSMSEFGFDSITFTELSNRLNRTYGLNLTPAVFFAHESPESAARHIYEVYGNRLDDYYRESLPEAAPQVQSAGKGSGNAAAAKRAGSMAQSAISKSAPSTSPSRPLTPDRSKAAASGQALPSAGERHLEPVAVVGAAGLFPQSDDIGQFWGHLAAGDNLVTEIPADRWDWRQYYGDPLKEPHKTNIIWGAFMNDPASFDPLFFGISPREAERLDPQARKAIETVYRAIEDAGYKPSDLSGTRTALFMGVSNADYSELMAQHGLESIATQSMLANRISFLLNLRGPSEPVDTACSSSLVAIHRAVEAIRNGGCEMAIAGGVNMIFSPNLYIYESQSGMLSPDGMCKTFDAAANGYVRGEGAGAVLLKPLSRAVEDGDHIYAVIRGTAINHGGRASSVTAPNSGAQADLIVEAYAQAGIDPATVSYIETHGTGTSLGDPVEIEGLKLAFDRMYKQAGHTERPQAHCGLGSVKTNTGHLESASGIAGFIKVLLAMKHRMLPGLIHYTKQNPYIRLEDSPFYLVTEATEWKSLTDKSGRPIPRRAGISSFGIGGVNAHIVLEQFEEREAAASFEEGHSHLFVLSARNKERLSAYAMRVYERLTAEADSGHAGERLSKPMQPGTTERNRVYEILLEEAADVLQVDPGSIDGNADLAEAGFDPASLETFLLRAASRLDADVYGISSGCRSLAELAHLWQESIQTDQAVAAQMDTVSLSESADEEAAWLAHAAYTLQVGREAMAERAAFLVRSKAELADKLLRFAEGDTSLTGVFAGNVQSGKEKLEWLTMLAPAGSNPAEQWLSSGNLEALAKLWTNGMAIDWEQMYGGRIMKRMPLPTYPFAQQRYWMETGPSHRPQQPSIVKPHPLLDYNSSTLRESSYTAMLDASGYYMKDHHVGRRPMLPGAAYAELAKAAAELAGEGQVSRIENMVWVRPFIGTHEPQPLKVVLVPQGDYVSFSMQGAVETGAQTVYAQGRLTFDGPRLNERRTIDLAAVQARCGDTAGPAAFYDMMGKLGIAFGPSFRSLQWIRTNQKEAMSLIRLPEHLLPDYNRYGLHPVLLDGALQTVTGLLNTDGSDPDSGYFPFSVQEIQIFDRLPAEIVVYAVLSKADAEFRTFDLWLTDTSGSVVASLTHYLVKRSERMPVQSLTPVHKPADAVSSPGTAAEQFDVIEILRRLHAGELDWEQADRLIGGAV